MSTLLHDLPLGAPASEVELLEADRQGRLLACLRSHSGPRWFRRDEPGWVELDLADDGELPLAAQIPRLRALGALEVLSWRPGRRLTAAHRRPSGPLVLKATRRSRHEAALARHVEARTTTGGQGFRVPALLDASRELACLTLECLTGRALAPTEANAERFFAAGVCLRAFQEHAPRAALELHGPAEEARVLDRMAERVRACGLDLPAGWTELRARFAEHAREQRTPTSFALCHRDLHDRQLLDLGGAIGLVDFDLLCQADPALDAANLCSHLQLRSLQALEGATPQAILACARALLDGLERDGEPDFRSRLRFYEASSFLRLALVHRSRPRWEPLVAPLLDYARRCLDELERG